MLEDHTSSNGLDNSGDAPSDCCLRDLHPHTKGPWQIERDGAGRVSAIVRTPDEDMDGPVTVLDAKDGVLRMTGSDAHLAAAAPDLLKAVRMMLPRADANATAFAREALYRAAGETPA